MTNKENRFQFQPWYVKLWRRRHQLLIPYEALRTYMGGRKRNSWGSRSAWHIAWSIAVGEADMKMEWWWTSDELKERLEKI